MRNFVLSRLVDFICPQFGVIKTVQHLWSKLQKLFSVYKAIESFEKMAKLPMKIGIGSVVLCLFIIIFGWVAFPKILKSQIKGMVSLKPGNEVRDMYLKVPFPLTFKVYMFNVTNPIEVAEKGAIPIVNEIGPFIYDEWKEKVEVIDNEKDDTLEYRIKNTFVFNKQESGSLTGDEVITMIHPLIAGIALAVEKDKPGALSLLNKALMSIYRNPTTPFLTAPVNAILFNGIDIACNVTDFAGKAVCSQLKAEATDLIEVEPGILRFSLFGPKNGTVGQKVKVKRGIKDIMDLGRVIEFEDKPELEIWGSKMCNTYEGTDSTIFPPFLTKEQGLVSFAPDICRSLPAYFIENSKYDGLPVRRYSADFGDQSTVKDERCYCPSDDFCYKKGIHDMSKCVGAPLVASLPHFYLSDESYQRGVRGLNPTQDKHEIIILFEHLTGTPVFAKKRMQFAMPLHPMPKITLLNNISEVMLPLIWLEEGVELNSTWTGKLDKDLFRVLRIVTVLKWTVLMVSISLMGVAGFLQYKGTKMVQITPVRKPQKKSEAESNGHVNPAMSTNELDKF